MWVWVAIGLGSFLALSLLVGLALARILGTIGRQISALHETEEWAIQPPTRAAREGVEAQLEEEPKSARVEPRENARTRHKAP